MIHICKKKQMDDWLQGQVFVFTPLSRLHLVRLCLAPLHSNETKWGPKQRQHKEGQSQRSWKWTMNHQGWSQTTIRVQIHYLVITESFGHYSVLTVNLPVAGYGGPGTWKTECCEMMQPRRAQNYLNNKLYLQISRWLAENQKSYYIILFLQWVMFYVFLRCIMLPTSQA